MIDLGAHGMYLIDWFLGLPKKYASAFTVWDHNEKNKSGLEDNATTVMTYEDGAIAVNETGFVSFAEPVIFEVNGDKGSVRYIYGQGIKKCTEASGRQTVEVEEGEGQRSPLAAFLRGEVPAGCGIEEAVHLTQMMEGAYKNIL